MPLTTIVGVISDTHGLVRPEAMEALDGSDLILHAGDIGSSAVLESLAEIAPVVAVRGNVDSGQWSRELPETVAIELAGLTIYMLHDRQLLDLKPETAGFAAVIFGHSHQPVSEQRNGVLYFNPGSAGPKRFKLPVCIGRLMIVDQQISPELVTLDV